MSGRDSDSAERILATPKEAAQQDSETIADQILASRAEDVIAILPEGSTPAIIDLLHKRAPSDQLVANLDLTGIEARFKETLSPSNLEKLTNDQLLDAFISSEVIELIERAAREKKSFSFWGNLAVAAKKHKLEQLRGDNTGKRIFFYALDISKACGEVAEAIKKAGTGINTYRIAVTGIETIPPAEQPAMLNRLRSLPGHCLVLSEQPVNHSNLKDPSIGMHPRYADILDFSDG